MSDANAWLIDRLRKQANTLYPRHSVVPVEDRPEWQTADWIERLQADLARVTEERNAAVQRAENMAQWGHQEGGLRDKAEHERNEWKARAEAAERERDEVLQGGDRCRGAYIAAMRERLQAAERDAGMSTAATDVLAERIVRAAIAAREK